MCRHFRSRPHYLRGSIYNNKEEHEANESKDRYQGREERRCKHDNRIDYRKLGFRNILELMHEGVPPEVFFALSFDGHIPQGTVTFHEGFKTDGRQDCAGNA